MTGGDAVALAVVLGTVAALASVVWSTLRLGISPMPTSRRARRALLSLVPPDVQGEVHELGAGWGGLALALAEACPRAQVIAWEASWVPWLVFRLRLVLRPPSNLELRRRDFFEADLSRAGLVVCYLWTGAMTRLSRKFDAELSPGAVVLSHTFGLRGWSAETTRSVDDLYRTPVYRYLMAERRAQQGGRPMTSV
jgi:hypothetical protein